MKLSIDPYPSPLKTIHSMLKKRQVELPWCGSARQNKSAGVAIWVLQKTRIILNLNSFILWGEVWGKGWMTGTQLSTHAFYTILFLFEGKWLERVDLNISTQTVPTWISLNRLDHWAARQRRGARTGRDEFRMRLYISTGSNEYYFVHKQGWDQFEAVERIRRSRSEFNKGWFQANFGKCTRMQGNTTTGILVKRYISIGP